MKCLLVPALLLAVSGLGGCAGDDEGAQEPISPDAEAGSGYSEDPDMSPPAGEEQPAPDATASDDEAGELTADPFGAPPADGGDADVPSDAQTADDYSKSFDNETPEPDAAPDQPAGQTAPVIPDDDTGMSDTADTADSGGDVGGSGDMGDGGGESGAQYVDALLLNVRSGPSMRSPIVRRLLGGAKVDVVETRGRYSKIKNGQWVATKHLSASPTRKVSRTEVTKAWRKSRYKDTWRPKR